MSRTIDRTRVRGAAAFRDVADAVLAVEDASDAALAAAGTLLSKAMSGRASTGVPIRVAQRILDDIEKMVMAQFDSRRALLAAHGGLDAVAKVSMSSEELPWGPDSSCPFASANAPATNLRSVA
ncbi:MAG TPA: hypothetical protein VFO80_07520 [Sphingomonas sp.]|nr:hypothetical protein [Sphingomonas sp.]